MYCLFLLFSMVCSISQICIWIIDLIPRSTLFRPCLCSMALGTIGFSINSWHFLTLITDMIKLCKCLYVLLCLNSRKQYAFKNTIHVFKLYIIYYKSKIRKIVFLKYFDMIEFIKCYLSLVCLSSQKQYAYRNTVNYF